MMKRTVGLALLLVLLFSIVGSAAASVHPFGTELTPLSEEELAEIEGEFGAELVKTAVGAAVGGIQYLITTDRSDWNWSDGVKHVAAGAVAGFVGSFF